MDINNDTVIWVMTSLIFVTGFIAFFAGYGKGRHDEYMELRKYLYK